MYYTSFNNYVALERCKQIIEDDFARKRNLDQYFKTLNDLIFDYRCVNTIEKFLMTHKIVVFETTDNNHVSNLMEINDISQVKIIDMISSFDRLKKYIALL